MQYKDNLPTQREIEAVIRRIKYKIGNEIRKEYENSGEYSKTGIKYPNLPNRSSAPYEPPAKQSGNLHSKIDVKLHNNGVMVGSDVKYLKYLELGTKKMVKRDGLNIAYKKLNITKIIDDILVKFFR
jgi:phage gpG-like protein